MNTYSIQCTECNEPIDHKEDYDACTKCCPHEEHDHWICMYCGFEGNPGDYGNEDYGQER